MVIDRRQVVLCLAGAIAAGPAWALERSLRYVSCRTDMTGGASAAFFDADGRELFSTILPSRGHDIARRHTKPEACIFARRPGNWAIIVDTDTGLVRKTLICEPGRYFYGHGVYSPNGQLLFATENLNGQKEGRIGLYDATNDYRRIGEISSHGIGPHDISLSTDGRTLIIANGGIVTNPATGRDNIDPDGMKPSLAFVDWNEGEATAALALAPDLRKLSIRHLAASRSGQVAFGCQYEGNLEEMPLLVGLADAAGTIRMLSMPEADLAGMQNYIGSVSMDAREEFIAATSPRGGRTAFWNAKTGAFIGSRPTQGACGVAPTARDAEFLVSSGSGGIQLLDVSTGPHGRAFLQASVWDNHMRRVDG